MIVLLLAWWGAATLPADAAAAQSRMSALTAAVRPALPFPAASTAGDIPLDGNTSSRWFVVWPSAPGDTEIIVRANPLHPDVQKAGADAMVKINQAVVDAERKAQASYDRALEQLRRAGTAATLEAVTLDDEGVHGERIDAELELRIALLPAVPFELGSSEAPVVATTPRGGVWMVSTSANTYRETSGAQSRERFRAAEVRILFALNQPPAVSRKGGDGTHYDVQVSPSPGAFTVVLRGNEALLQQVIDTVDWSVLRQ